MPAAFGAWAATSLLSGATTGVAFTVVSSIVTLAATVALSYATTLLMGKPRQGGPTGQEITVRDTASDALGVYGEVRVGGNVAYQGTSGTTNQYYWVVIVVARHECTAITDVWLEGTRIPHSAIDPATGAVSGTFNDKVKIWRYLGTSQQTALSDLFGANPAWDDSMRGRGVAYFVCRLEYDTETFPNGSPQNFFCLVKGRKLYDPRKDSTNGGGGSHRLDRPDSWEWSDNPKLCQADYLTGGAAWYDTATIGLRLGMKIDPSLIGWGEVAAGANTDDEMVALPDGGSQKRFQCNGVVSYGETHRENMARLLSADGGKLARTGGRYRLYCAEYNPPVHSMSEKDLAGAYSIQENTPPSDLRNHFTALYFDAARSYQYLPSKPRKSSAYETEDGRRLTEQIDCPMTTNEYQAQVLAEIAKRQTRNQIVFTGVFGLNAYKVRLWETLSFTLTERGWTNKVFRCTDWSFNVMEEQITLVMREESASAYADPNDLAIQDDIESNGGVVQFAGPPRNLTGYPLQDAIFWDWDAPDNAPIGTVYLLYTSITGDFTDQQLGYRGSNTQGIVKFSDTTARFARVYSRFAGRLSTPEPPVGGVQVGQIGAGGGGGGSLAAIAEPGSVNQRLWHLTFGQASGVLIAVFGGSGTISYSWARLSGSTKIGIMYGTAAAFQNWFVDGIEIGERVTATWRCTVTDASGSIYVDVPVTFQSVTTLEELGL